MSGEDSSVSSTLVSVPASDIAAVMPFRAHGDIRYYLDGIFVEPCTDGGCMIVATEGHMLAAIYSETARADEPRILRITDGLEEALQQDSAIKHGVVTVADGRVILTERGVESFVQPGTPFINGRYPEWRKPVPPREHLKPGAPMALQARYLAKLWKANRSERATGVMFHHDSRNPSKGCAVVQFHRLPLMVVVIMAMDLKHPEWPKWMPSEPPKQEDAA